MHTRVLGVVGLMGIAVLAGALVRDTDMFALGLGGAAAHSLSLSVLRDRSPRATFRAFLRYLPQFSHLGGCAAVASSTKVSQ